MRKIFILVFCATISLVLAASSKRHKDHIVHTRTESDFKTESSIVADVSLDQLELIAREPNWPVFVMFTNFDQPASKDAWPAFRDAAAALQGVAPFVTFNCKKKEHADVCKIYCNNVYPMLALFPPGALKPPVYYFYDRRTDLLVDFVLGNLDTYVAHVESREVASFLRRAESFPRVVFFSDKLWLDPRLNTMAFQHRMRTVVGKVSKPSGPILKQYNLTQSELPTAIAFPLGQPPRKFGKKLGDSDHANWGDFGKFINEFSLERVKEDAGSPLELHESFSSARPVSQLEKLNATTFSQDVFEINSTKTLVLFYHGWMISCRRLYSVYELVPDLLKNTSIDIAVLNLDENANDARRLQSQFSIKELPSIIFFPGNADDPFKMETLNRDVELDSPVTPEEIAHWVLSQDDYFTKQKMLEAEAKRARAEAEEKDRQYRKEHDLPPRPQAREIILNLEDSTEDEKEANVEKHYIIDTAKKGQKIVAEKVEL